MANTLLDLANNLDHKLNVNMDIIMKNVKLGELNTKIAKAILGTQEL